MQCLTYFGFLNISPVGPFYGLLSVNFAHAKSYPETFGHLYSDLLAINVYQGVKICN